MNPPDDDFEIERLLLRQPRPELPPAWRDEILRAAAAPAPKPWYRRPYAIGIAACWAITGLLALTMPPRPPATASSGAAPLRFPGSHMDNLPPDNWLAVTEYADSPLP